MYQLVTARYRKNRRSGRWTEGNLATEPVTTLTTKFGDVYLFITYPSITEPKALRFDKVSNWLGGVGPTVTVQAWLTSLGNKTLPFEETTPDFTPRYVKYAQAWHAGYAIEPIARFGHVEDGGSKFDKEDLWVVHPKFTPAEIATQAMISVNGYFHLVDHTIEGVRIFDGNKSLRLANDNEIGIHSFEEVGKIKYCPIKPEMISAQSTTAKLKDATYITIPESYDITNKTVLLVVGGHLQVLDRSYVRVGERTWRVMVNELGLLSRWMLSRNFIDLSPMGLEVYEPNPSLVNTTSLMSDEALTGYLTLSQSFFVIVDTESMFHELEPIEYCGFPGRYLDDSFKRYPLIGAYGRMLEYHVIKEDVKYVYCTTDNIRKNYDFMRTRWQRQTLVDGGCYPAVPFEHTEAYYRIMGSEG